MDVRRSFLYVPGNNPDMLQNAGVFGADVLVLDLEDAVAPPEKDAARFLIAGALRHVDYGNSEIAIRINSFDTFGKQDVKAMVLYQPDLLLIPKVNCANDIHLVVEMLEATEAKEQKPIKLIAIIESPQGVAEVYNIAKSHLRLVGLMFGAEDYTALIGSERTKAGNEIFTARNLIVNAAAATGIQSFDAVFTDVNDDEGLIQDTLLSKQLGFTGKPAIHPRQIKLINNIFSPSSQEFNLAERIIEAARQATQEGSGVASLNGKMIDAPIVKRAQRTMYLARTLGLRKEG